MVQSMQSSCRIDSLIAEFSIHQAYGRYTKDEHDTWALATSELREVLQGQTAVEFHSAFEGTGMASTHIPSLADINDALKPHGWKAIVVEGFIPPDVFMTLQASAVLPITRSIRSREQLGYTPVPDIIHEAAGHLPMLHLEEYRSFLQRLGEIGSRVTLQETDLLVYEKQKALAELLADTQSDANRIAQAKRDVVCAVREAKAHPVSAARRIARFHWWTVEYGLIGADHLIYGAGLWSSAGEVRGFRRVPHYRLSVECCEQSFDIDHAQPFYFVADSWDHLNFELDQLECLT